MRNYGDHAVEANCPAEKLVFAVAKRVEGYRQKVDSLLRDLRAVDGDPAQTWLRMALLFNPHDVRRAFDDMKASERNA